MSLLETNCFMGAIWNVREVCPQTRGPFWVLDCSSCLQDLSSQESKAFNHYWFFYFKDSNKETGDRSVEISTKQMNIILKRKHNHFKNIPSAQPSKRFKNEQAVSKAWKQPLASGCACESIGPFWRLVWTAHSINAHTFSEEMPLLGI